MLQDYQNDNYRHFKEQYLILYLFKLLVKINQLPCTMKKMLQSKTKANKKAQPFQTIKEIKINKVNFFSYNVLEKNVS